MTRQDVQEIILGPMRALFMPGQHVRSDPTAQARALEEYVLALEHFDRQTLQSAWNVVRNGHDLVVWPTPAQFVQAATLLQPRPRPPSEALQKREQAIDMKDAKIREYRKTSKLYQQAKREGWGAALMDFVEDQVWIQAQVLCECEVIAFSGRLWGNETNVLSAKEAYQQIREWIGERFLEDGKPRVKPPPAEFVERWKVKAKSTDRERYFKGR